MNQERHEIEHAKGQFLVYQAEDGRLKLEVRLEDETVWLTQPLMADLFQTTQQNISQHILNIYEEEVGSHDGSEIVIADKSLQYKLLYNSTDK